jgi:hypothetical protein
MRTLFVFGLVALLAGCDKKDPPPASTESTAPASPVDHLAPGEVPEGKDKAFALVLPRGVTVEHSFVDVIFARGTVPAELLANYVRTRVQDGKVTVGAGRTVFDQVKVPSDPKRLLHIRIDPAADGIGARIEVRDVTPPPPDNLPDEESRWRSAGLKPNGEQLDPKHTQ